MDEENGVETVYGKVFKRKQRKLRRKILVKEQLEDFASNTTLHGLGYITRRDVTTIEKVFWLIAFCVSACVCFYQINNVWWKWHNSPVIVSINDELISVSQVPFPSITICPQVKIHTHDFNYANEKRKFEKFKNSSDNASIMTIEERERFEDVSFLCDKELFDENDIPLLDRNFSNSAVLNNILRATRRNLLGMNIASEYRWRKKYHWYLYSWNKVYTKEGICYNFNSLANDDIFREDVMQRKSIYARSEERIKNWSMEKGYVEGMTNETYPRRGRENGADPDLSMILTFNPKGMDTECNVLYSGYKVFVQHPADMPQATLYSYALLPQQTSSFALRFNMITTSPALKQYTPEKRRCYFPDERYLRYFKIYTENNCRIECLSNYTFNECDCVAFYMPRDTSNRICTIQKMLCMELALEKMAEGESSGSAWDPDKCNCLPACDSVEYDAEILKTEFNFKKHVHQVLEKSDPNDAKEYDKSKTSYSRLEMYFKSPRFLSMRRSELFGTTDFIANCGGLLGLFLGFSFLSLLEIIYFSSLRLWCTFKRDSDAHKPNTENINTVLSEVK